MYLSPATLRLNGCQPRNLASLMDLYEGNYRRLMRLAPDLERLGESAISRVGGALDLHLSVIDRFKYTSQVALTYRFAGEGGVLLEPNVQIRLYHDARVAEAMRHRRRRPVRFARCRRRAQASELEHKWELNRFLQRWLGYCLHQGHLFLDYDGCANRARAGRAGTGVSR